MRSRMLPAATLAVLLAWRAVSAQTGDVETGGGVPVTQRADSTKKEKDRFLAMLDDVETLARWMTNEPGFVSVLDDVRQRVLDAKGSDLAPLDVYDPHYASLEAAFSRIRGRMSRVQGGPELCDPSKSEDLFLLFVDAVNSEGQREADGKICERLAALEGNPEAPPALCLGTHMAFLAAKAMHDLVALCDPAMAAKPDAGLDLIRSDIAGVNVQMQESVRSAKKELTKAMTVVAGHVSDVSAVNTTSIRDEVEAGLRLEIEKALEAGKTYASIYLPSAYGGQLEAVRRIVLDVIAHVRESGESLNGAPAKVAAADEEFHQQHYKKAYHLYCEAYVAVVGLAGQH